MISLRRSHHRFALALLLAALHSSPALADPPAPPSSLPTEAQRRATLLAFDPAAPEAPASGAPTNSATQDAYDKAMQAYFSYRQQGYLHRQQAFEWQSWSSKVIFFAVLLLVLSGMAFASVQFYAGMRRAGPASPTDGTGSTETGTELELGLQGVKVRSPVLGVVVLTISLAFFYLYLVYVYPIVNAF